MSKILELFSSIDFYPITPVFYIKGNEGFQSISGGFKSLVMAVSFLYLLYDQVLNYINTENPSELTKTEIIANYSVSLNHNNFFFAVSFSFDESPYFDFYKYIKVGRILHTNGVDHNNHQYHDDSTSYFSNCSRIDFSQFQISDSMKQKLISEAKCLILNNLTMNNFEFDADSNLELVVYYDDFYKQYLSGHTSYDTSVPINITLYYQNIISSPSNFNESPIKKTINAKTHIAYIYNSYEYVSSIMTITSIRKGDFLRKSEYKKKFTYFYINKFDIANELTVSRYASKDNFFYRIFSLRLILDDKNEMHIITYPTVMDVISNLGGTLGLILAAADLLLEWAQKFEQTQYIINKCFNNDSIFYDSPNEKTKNENQNRGLFHTKTKSSSKNFTPEERSIIVSNNDNNNNINISVNNPGSLSIDGKSCNLKRSYLYNNVLPKADIGEKLNSNIKRSKTLAFNDKERVKKFTASTIQKKKSHAQLSFFFFKSEKSPYTKLFQMFLGLENIVKWNEEWLAYKSLIFSKNTQILFKYVNLYKLYKSEQNLNPFDKNQEEFTNTWKHLADISEQNEKQYVDKFKRIIETSFMK